MAIINTAEVVIWSADVGEEMLDKILRLDTPLKYVKLDRVGLMRMGTQKIDEVQNGYDKELKVFADAKIIEIGDKVIELAKEYLKFKPYMLNIMAGSCSSGILKSENIKEIDALKRFADICHDYNTRPCAVSVLTNKTPEMVAREFNGRTPIEQVLVYAEMLVDAGFTDLVCSPLEISAIRSDTRFNNLCLVNPGVRLPGTDARDQARISTPLQTVLDGALLDLLPRLVIGSNLTDGDFVTNWARIDANLNPITA